eukprot:2492516-Rhodomonas_salina.2
MPPAKSDVHPSPMMHASDIRPRCHAGGGEHACVSDEQMCLSCKQQCHCVLCMEAVVARRVRSCGQAAAVPEPLVQNRLPLLVLPWRFATLPSSALQDRQPGGGMSVVKACKDCSRILLSKTAAAGELHPVSQVQRSSLWLLELGRQTSAQLLREVQSQNHKELADSYGEAWNPNF